MRSASRFWRDPGTRDLLVAGALTLYGQVEAWTFSSLDGPRAAVAAITAATTAVTVFRRRAPIAVAVAVIALVLIGGAAWNVPDQLVSPSLALLLACYSVGAHAPLRAAVAGLAAVLVPLFGASLAAGHGSDFLFLGTIFAGVWAAGCAVRSRRALAAQLADRAVVLESERDRQVAAAAAAERSRIARELHDVVAHCVNVMVLQAGAERRVLGDERPDTTAALRDIEDTGRQALGELRRLLGIVRAEDGEPPLEPQPTLADLDTLIEQINHAGLTTELRVDGQRRPLPPGLELSAYRIVQEALTNVLKHSSAHAARVIVRYRPGALELEITDDGTATGSASMNGGSHGLIGMRERAALFDGAFTAGPRPAGGYGVAVRLPLEPGG